MKVIFKKIAVLIFLGLIIINAVSCESIMDSLVKEGILNESDAAALNENLKDAVEKGLEMLEEYNSKGELGSGETAFKLEITDKDGKTGTYTIKTDETTVGNALKHADVKLISNDSTNDKITAVNGVEAEDGASWIFYADGSTAGIFDTNVTADATYKLKYEQDSDEE